MKNFLTDINSGTSSVKAYLQLCKRVDKTKYVLFEFKGMTDQTTYAEIDVTPISNGFSEYETFTNGDHVIWNLREQEKKEVKDFRDLQDFKDSRVIQVGKVIQGIQDFRDLQDFKDFKDIQDSKDLQDSRDFKEEMVILGERHLIIHLIM